MPVRNAHSLFFETMAELGIVGWSQSSAFLASPPLRASRRGPTRSPGAVLGAALAVFTAGVVSAAIDWTWELPACFGLVVLAAGLLAGPRARAGDSIRRRASCGERLEGAGPRAHGRGSGSAWRRCWCGWAAIWAGGVLFLTEVRLGDSHQAANDGNLEAAAEDARDAITIEPWAAGPRLQLALVDELAGDLPSRKARGIRSDRSRPRQLAALVCADGLDVKSGDVPMAPPCARTRAEPQPASTLLSLSIRGAQKPGRACDQSRSAKPLNAGHDGLGLWLWRRSPEESQKLQPPVPPGRGSRAESNQRAAFRCASAFGCPGRGIRASEHALFASLKPASSGSRLLCRADPRPLPDP